MVNPYIEIVARAVYNKETNVQVPSTDWELAKKVVNDNPFYGTSLRLQGNTLIISYKNETEE